MNGVQSRGRDPSSPIERYHLLRAAVALFKRPPADLPVEEAARAHREARRSLELESLVLASPEAGAVVIDQTQVERAVAEVRARYADEAAYRADLARNGLDEEALAHALYRELLFDGVMRRVGARRTEVDEAEVRAWYDAHPEGSRRPERRHARHILITINPDFPENTRERALARIRAVAAELDAQGTGAFEALARAHSECPTAMEGGQLGAVTPGTLFPELDARLFTMEAGAVSEPVESSVGYHLLWCERIEPGRTFAYDEVRERIAASLDERRRVAAQREWIAGLRHGVTGS